MHRIKVPQVIPLRLPVQGLSKNTITSSTPIEIIVEDEKCKIFFTVDGSRPDPFKQEKNYVNQTFKYIKPFVLCAGNRIVRAVSVNNFGEVSNIVTKTFDVKESAEPSDIFVTDDIAFIDEILKMRNTNQNSFSKPPSRLNSSMGTRNNFNEKQITKDDKEEEISEFKCKRCYKTKQNKYIGNKKLKICLRCCEDEDIQTSNDKNQSAIENLTTCESCGGVVPDNLLYCIACEAPLGENAEELKVSCPRCSSIIRNQNKSCSNCGFSSSSQRLICSSCLKENAWNSQICYWCETKLVTNSKQAKRNKKNPLEPTPCVYCNNPNDRFSNFCNRCGKKVKNDDLLVNRKIDVETQTNFLYPSAKKIQTEQQKIAEIEEEVKRRAVLLTAISPGKGYWRKQLEHIIAHLKIFTTNNDDFRNQIGNPKLGKLMYADLRDTTYDNELFVDEEENNSRLGEATITLKFVNHEMKNPNIKIIRSSLQSGYDPSNFKEKFTQKMSHNRNSSASSRQTVLRNAFIDELLSESHLSDQEDEASMAGIEPIIHRKTNKVLKTPRDIIRHELNSQLDDETLNSETLKSTKTSSMSINRKLIKKDLKTPKQIVDYLL